eukprot:scaffold2.g7215.t1
MADQRVAAVPAEALLGGNGHTPPFIEQEAETYLGEPFKKAKARARRPRASGRRRRHPRPASSSAPAPLMKLANIDNPQFTEQDVGPWAPPLVLRKFNHVALEAVDVVAICRFYTKVMGFREVSVGGASMPGASPGPRLSRPPCVTLSYAHWPPELPVLPAGWALARKQEAYSQESEAWMIRRSNHVAFEVEDFEAAEETLKRHGVEYSRQGARGTKCSQAPATARPHVLPEANVQQLFFYDPEGGGIEIGRYDNTRAFFQDHGEPPTP